MQITQDFWFLLFFVDFFLLGFVGVYAFYTYYKRLTELKKLQAEAYKKTQEILEEARNQSKDIFAKVEQKTEEILAHSQLFKTDMDREFRESLNKLADNYLQIVQEHSKKFTQDYDNILTSVKDQSLGKVILALDSIGVEIRNQLAEAKNELKAEMLKSLTKAQAEIENYKKAELEKIDQEIDKVVAQMSKDLLRINLSPKDHKKLVIQALDKAKQQGAFFL
ncbi:hypothetical protein A2963_02765 [Candidatus Roizmanbacteria bacterium RIFCSPLOWO2_01_FULL_40_13]|nr:MAG: hypothetical protein A2963_02765 [Candidatus Roizmanbacteria bacterium RIFCSPLOWO2_01_FULL_40_13]